MINLRSDMTLSSSDSPLLFADGDPLKSLTTQHQPSVPQGTEYELAWKTPDGQNAQRLLYTRLLFLFTDIVYIFAEDFPDFQHVIDFLTDCIKARSASMLQQVRPHLVVVLTEETESLIEVARKKQFHQDISQIGSVQLSEVFSGVSLIHLIDCGVSQGIPDEKLRQLMLKQSENMRALRRTHRTLYAASHLSPLFEAALQHTATTIEKPFDFIKAMRKEDDDVPQDLSEHLAHYLDIGSQAGCSYEDLAPLMASAIVMDHYVPDMHCECVTQTAFFLLN